MVVRTFTVIAYDISEDRQRDRLSKYLQRFGIRANYSVFECMLTESQFQQIKITIPQMIDASTDRVLMYRLCKSCYVRCERFGNHRQLPQKPIIEL